MMKNIPGLRSLWRFRSLIGSASYESFTNLQIRADKLIREQSPVKLDVEIMHTRGAKEHKDLLEGKLQQDVNENAKLKVKQAENLKCQQGLCSNDSSARRLCDQLTALQQVASHTEQAEEGKKFFEEMLGKNFKGLDKLNCLLDDLSTELEHAEEKHTRGAKEHKDLLEGKLQQAVNENAKLKVKPVDNSKLRQGLCSNVSSARRLCDKLTALQKLASNTEQAEKGKKFFEEMLGKNFKGLDKLNCLLDDLSTELEHAEEKIVSAEEDNNFFEEMIVKHFRDLDEFNWLLHVLSTKLDHAEQSIISDDLEQDSVKTYRGMTNPMISGTLRPQISYKLRTNWWLHKRLFHQTARLTFGRNRKFQQYGESIFQNLPGNTARIVLNPDDLIASKCSYLKAIRKIQSWCKSRSKPIDLSDYFGPGAEVYTTPEDGVFHLTFEYKGREITFFISGSDLYIRGWEVDRVKLFEIREKDNKTEHFIKDSRCIPIDMGVNYCHLWRDGNVGYVRLGFKAMTDSFEGLHKSSSLSDAVMRAVAVFAVNGPEAVRFEWVLEDTLEAFDISLELDSKRNLSSYVRKYSHYSCEYLTYVHQLTNGLPLPKIIQNKSGGNIRDIHELRSLLSIPLRTALKKTSKKATKEEQKSPIWSPPYPDGEGWLLKEEEQLLKEEEQKQKEEQLLKEEELKHIEEQLLKEEMEHIEKQLLKEEEQQPMEKQEGAQVEDHQKMEDHSIGGSIIRCKSFVNAGAPGVQIRILPSGYPSWPKIAKFLRWFIR